MRTGARRRAVVLLALAVACGGLAATQVNRTVRGLEAQVGPPVPVVIASAEVSAGTALRSGKAERLLTTREVPERFIPPDSLAAPEEALGLRTAVAIPAGGYVTLRDLEQGTSDGGPGEALAPGERVVEVAVAGAGALGDAEPGTRVDILVTSDSKTGGDGRTYLALEDVELLELARGGADELAEPGGGAETTALAALRVTVRQATMLAAADSFAREIRLLARPRGDDRRVGPTATSAGAL